MAMTPCTPLFRRGVPDRSAEPARPRGRCASNTDRMLSMIDSAVAGSAPFLPVRLVVVPGVRARGAGLSRPSPSCSRSSPSPIPNEHTERLTREGARARDLHPERHRCSRAIRRWPGVVFNTTCLIGPDGILYKYRKVNPWIPYEVHASPHDLPGYDEPLFPVAETPIGRIGCAICYDWLFPEAIRQLAANGAEVLIRVSAYMDPWGATEPMNWWTIVNRCRAIENIAYVVAANQGASLRHYPPYSWPGGSQVVDFDGRMLAEASPGPGERIVVAPIDVSPLRHERATRQRPSHARPPAHRGVSRLRAPPVSPARCRGSRRVVRAQPGTDRAREARMQPGRIAFRPVSCAVRMLAEQFHRGEKVCSVLETAGRQCFAR